MFPGPVLIHELRSAARKPWLFLLRLFCGLVLFYFMLVTFRSLEARQELISIREMSTIGIGLFTVTLWIQGLTVIFLTPAIVGGTIAEDRQRKILLFLLASPLSSGEIVLGKLCVRILYLVSLVLVGFPILSLALLFGGVDPPTLLLTQLGVLAVVFFLGSLSVFLSSRLKRPRDAIVVAYFCVFCWLMLPFFTFMINAELVSRWPILFEPLHRAFEFLSLSTPFGVLDGITRRTIAVPGSSGADDGMITAILTLIGLNILFGVLFLAPTIFGLRRREMREGVVGRRWGFSWLGKGGPRWSRHRLFSLDDPILWKECIGHFQFHNRWLNGFARVARMAACILLIVWMLTYAGLAFQEVMRDGYGESANMFNNYRNSFLGAVKFMSVCGYILGGLLVAAVAAGSVSSEKEKDTWISLVSTQLDGAEILRGKFLGSLWTARYLYVALFVLWLTAVIVGSLHPLSFVAVLVATTVYSCFIAALGVHFSSVCRTSTRALVATFATLLFLNGGYLFCCAPILTVGRWSGGIGLMFIPATCFYLVASLFGYSEWSQITGSPPNETSLSFTAGFICSVIIHAVATTLLLSHRIANFDTDVDRPVRSPWSTTRRRNSPVVASKEGITFLESNGDAMDDSQDEANSPGQF